MRRIEIEPCVSPEADRYQTLLANAPVGIYRVSHSGEVLDGNAALARILGYNSVEELMELGDRGPFGRPARTRFVQLLSLEKEIGGYESEWISGRGAKVFLREHSRAVYGAAGEIVWFEGTLEDISDRRMAEKQIQAERDFSSAVIDTAESLVLILSPEGRIERFNRACETLSGYSLHEVAGRPVWEVFSPDDEAVRIREGFERLASGEFPRRHSCSWRLRSGEVRVIEWSDSAMLNDRGEIRFVISAGIDITERKIAEDALRRSECRYRELFESASDIVFRASLDWDVLSINNAAERITGFEKSGIKNIGQLLDPPQLGLAKQMLNVRLDGAAETRFELPIRAAGGNLVHLDLSATICYEKGQPVEILGIGRDITWRKRQQEFERGRRVILEMAARHEPIDKVLVRLAALVESQFPKAVCRIALAPRERDLEQSVTRPQSVPQYLQVEEGTPEFISGLRMTWNLPVLSGEKLLLASIVLMVGRAGRPTVEENDILVTAANLATLTIEHRRMTEGIRWDAQHDKLTGLANRQLFENRLRAAIGDRESLASFAIFFVDLDRFKLINDTLGHAVGDQLLKAVAERLTYRLGDRGFVARMGGDEFMLMADPVDGRAEAAKIAANLLACFETPFEAGGHELFVSASIGSSIYPGDGEDGQSLRSSADTAMYRAKALGSNRFVQFVPSMTAGMARRLKIQNELHRAIDRRELRVHYQPQHDLKEDRMIGAEALIRWNSRDMGPVNPGEFIPVAEESGLIIPIGAWVLREACRQGRIWLDCGLPLKVAVNVSALQFARPGFFETVEDTLSDTGLPPGLLELELTESAVMQEPAEALAELERLRRLGVQISIDDFGTGYSSLSSLQSLPIQSLKIDLSFVRSIPRTEAVPPLIRAITALARGLNMEVLAEGVEQQFQVRALRSAGCDRVQGYLYGRPVPSDDLTRLLSSRCRPSQFAM